MIATVLLAAAAALPAPAIAEPDPKAMSYKQIRVFNAKLPRSHRYYIRCVKSANIGSLVARNVSCRTNEQWAHAEDVGNDNAREIYDAFRPRGNPNQPGT